MPDKPFRVLIAGASVTGLALASMLESAGIDYLILEAHATVAPPIGASIGLMGGALRILDQIGCFEAIRKQWHKPTRYMTVANSQGKPLTCSVGNMEHLETRHGYPLIFIDRQDLLKIMYANVKNKNKILVNKRIEEVVTAVNGVLVKTKDGETYTGDILIGADGVHSTVRREMHRLASESRPGYFPDDELSKVECNRRIMYGITKPIPSEPFIAFTSHNNHTYLSSSGTDDVIYWFLFDDIEPHSGHDIPRFTKEDEKPLVDKFGSDRITERWTLRELYDQSTITGSSAVVEHVWERWHFQRIMTIGDSAHVQHPISGYGGMSCLESSAAFINALKSELDGSPGGLTDKDIHSMFAEIQESRLSRVKRFVKGAKKMGDLLALKGPPKYLMKYIAPIIGQQNQLFNFSKLWVGAVRLNHLPVPKRPRAVPYDDEFPAKPIRGVSFPKYLAAAALLVSLYVSDLSLRMPPFTSLDTFAGLRPALKIYTGNEGLDNLCTILASFFSFSLVLDDPLPRIQLLELLSILSPIIAIWTIEASRKANRFSLITLPSLFTIGAQLRGLGLVGHLYYLAAIFTASNSVIERHVPVAVSKAVLPAVCLGYILPTIMMFLPFQDDTIWERLIVFWQPTPALVAALTILIAAGIRLYESSKHAHKDKYTATVDQAKDWYNKRDLAALKTTYAFVFASSALLHVSIVLYAWTDSRLSLAGIFCNLPSPFVSDWGITDLAEATLIFFKYDLVFSSIPLLVFLLHTIWDIRKLGYITTSTALETVLAVLVGQVVVGPPATYAGLWYWRETVLADLST